MRQPIPFIGAQANSRIAEVNDQLTINLIPTPQKPNARAPQTLTSTPGLLRDGSVGTGPCRSNGVKWKGDLYFISGNELVKRNSSGNYSSIGSINSNSGWVVIARGRNHLALVDGMDGFYYDGTTFAQITDPDFPANPTHIDYLDGRWIVNNQGSDQFSISELEDPTNWDPLDFATAEANPDNILAFSATEKDLYFIGEETAQAYYNSSNQDFPFDPYINGVIEVGIDAPYSLVQSTQGLFWLASNSDGDLFVVQVQGFSPRMISDPEMNSELYALSKTDDARGSLFRMEGRTYYVLNFPSADRTYYVDVDTGAWFRRKSYGLGRHRAEGFGYLGKKVICGDYTNSNFYELDFDTFTDDGGVIERSRRGQIIVKDQRNVIYHEFVLEMRVGVGNAQAPGDDPTVLLRYSDDGGKTWSSWLSRSIGKIGEYSTRVVWYTLGRGRNRIFEIRVTDPVSVEIFNAYADVEVLPY